MCSDRILEETRPSPELLRQWGYDESLYFIEQDEDRLLHEVGYLPVLLELAADPTCPKQRYVASIVYSYGQLCVLQQRAEADQIAAIAQTTPYASAPFVAEWSNDYLWLYDRLKHPRVLEAYELERLAWGLLGGTYCLRTLQRTGRQIDSYTEFLAATESFRGHLYIDATRGHWKYSGHYPLDRITG